MELPSCPATPEPLESEDQVALELRQLRRDLTSTCVVLRAVGLEEHRRQWFAITEFSRLHSVAESLPTIAAALDESVKTLRAKLAPDEGFFPVRVAGQTEDLAVVVPGGVEVTDAPDVAAVEAAVTSANETSNSNLWAIAGLAAGALLLIVFWRVVRP